MDVKNLLCEIELCFLRLKCQNLTYTKEKGEKMNKNAVSTIMLTLLILLLLSAFPTIAYGSTHESLHPFADGPFIGGTTQDLPLKTTPESFYPSEVDIIHPEPGQFANYYSESEGSYGWWNTSYNEYVQPHVVNTTHTVQPSIEGTYWCTVDTTNRLVTDTSPDFWWNQTAYIFWIETNVTVGSTINWWTTTATIVGSETLYILGDYIDCWVANVSYTETHYELPYYDKISGLLVKDQAFSSGELIFEITLNATNIPIGKLSTAVYFNFNPNPAGVGETVTLKGILVDESSQPLADEMVKLYARPLAGAWRYIKSLTTSEKGVFKWQASIPREGTFTFAVYYPGSETYERCYDFAILIIQ
jgi:hypothetical protein